VVAERSQTVSPQPVRCVYGKKETDTASLVLAIVGLAGSIVCPPAAPIWLVCAIVGLVLARRRREIMQTTVASSLSIAGIVVSALATCLVALYALVWAMIWRFA